MGVKFQEPAGGHGDEGRRNERAERVERQGAGEVEAQEGGQGPQGPAAPAVLVEEKAEQAARRVVAHGGPEAEGPGRDGGGQARAEEGVEPPRQASGAQACEGSRAFSAHGLRTSQRQPSTYWIDRPPARISVTLPS